MKTILDTNDVDYKSLQATTLPLDLNKYIESGIEKREDVNCYTYKSLENFELLYPDCIGNEYSNNKVYIGAGYGIIKALRISLEFAFTIAGIVGEISNSFNIVISYDCTDFVVSFYCKRDGEEWLADDLDSYTEEAIFVIAT